MAAGCVEKTCIRVWVQQSLAGSEIIRRCEVSESSEMIQLAIVKAARIKLADLYTVDWEDDCMFCYASQGAGQHRHPDCSRKSFQNQIDFRCNDRENSMESQQSVHRALQDAQRCPEASPQS